MTWIDLSAATSRSTVLRKRMNSTWRWRCMQRPMTAPSSTLRAANRVVVPFVVMGHGLAAPGLDLQSGLGAVERLDLAFFIDRQHHRMGRRIDIEPNNISELVGKAGIARALEAAQPVRLQFVRLPDALH